MIKIIFKLFGVALNGDCTLYDRHIWLKKNLILLNEKSNLLDVGCGNGWALFIAKKKGFKNSIGLSWDQNDIERIKRRTNDLNNIDFKVGDARKLGEIKFEQKFDAIVNAENIEHIIDSDKLIKDISDLLNDHGLLYLTTPNILYRNIYGDTPIKKPPIEDGGHVIRGYSKERLNKILKKHKLHIISVDYISGTFSRKLLELQRILPFKILSKIVTLPLTIICNFLDNIFYKNHKNNISLALIAEKIDAE